MKRIVKINSPIAAKEQATLIIIGFGFFFRVKSINRVLTIAAKTGINIAKNVDGFIFISALYEQVRKKIFNLFYVEYFN